MPDTEKLKEYTQATVKWGSKHVATIKGLAALLFGVSLIYKSHSIIINLIIFSCGLFLIYYALIELRLQKITAFIDKIVSKILRN